MHSLPQSNQENHNTILQNKISTKIKIQLSSKTVGLSLSTKIKQIKKKKRTYSCALLPSIKQIIDS